MTDKKYNGTHIKTPPDVLGKNGNAWLVDFEKARQYDVRGDFKAQVASYVVLVPDRHPAWDYWIMTCVHLREEEGLKPPVLRYPDATHEIVFMALDPAADLPDPKDFKRFAFLSPVDFAEQFLVDNDAQAHEVLSVLVTLVCDGTIKSPDVDYAQMWTAALWKSANKIRKDPGPVTQH